MEKIDEKAKNKTLGGRLKTLCFFVCAVAAAASVHFEATTIIFI